MTDQTPEPWDPPPGGPPAETEATLPAAAPAPDFIGQSTHIEATRAAAEVVTAVRAAKALPRDLGQVRRDLRASCQSEQLAAVAFYSYNRGGNVSGITVHLAREIGRCFGNFDSGWAELDRDEPRGRSEVMAWAWDMEKNTRRQLRFIVPHRSYVGKDQDPMETLRDIYEGVANQASRRERSVILSLVPQSIVAEAEMLCRQTLEKGPKGVTVEQRRTRAVDAFRALGVGLEQLEAKLGRPLDGWDQFDLAELTVLAAALSRRQTSVAEAFPAPVSIDDLPLSQAPPAQAEPGTGPGDTGDPEPDPPATEPPRPPGDSPDPTEDDIRVHLRARKVKVGDAIRHAQRDLGYGGGVATVDDIAADPECARLVLAWADEREAAR